MSRLISILALLLCATAANAQNGLAKDWKKAIWRSPVHIALSIPITVATVVVPPVGKAYVQWRERAEASHVVKGSDTPQKAVVDLYSQTALPRRVLRFYHIKVK